MPVSGVKVRFNPIFGQLFSNHEWDPIGSGQVPVQTRLNHFRNEDRTLTPLSIGGFHRVISAMPVCSREAGESSCNSTAPELPTRSHSSGESRVFLGSVYVFSTHLMKIIGETTFAFA